VFHSDQQAGHDGYFWDAGSVIDESSKPFPHFAHVLDINRSLATDYFIVFYKDRTRFRSEMHGILQDRCMMCRLQIPQLIWPFTITVEFPDVITHLFHANIFVSARIAFVRKVCSMGYLLMLH
jgi:hypothetical protein